MKNLKLILLLICLIIPFAFVGCENENKISLSTPTGCAVEDGIISFNPVENAEYYIISLNNVEINVDANHNSNVTLVDNKINYDATKILVLGETYRIKVKAKAKEMVDSKYTNEIEYVYNEILNTPTNVKIENKVLSWDIVKDADYYNVKLVRYLNSQTQEIRSDVNMCNLSVPFEEMGAGEYNISVKAIKTNLPNNNSGYSNSIKYSNVVKLSTPTISNIFENGGVMYLDIKDIDEDANAISIVHKNITKTVMLNNTTSGVTKFGDTYRINLVTVFGEVDFSQLGNYVFYAQTKYITSSSSFYENSNMTEACVYNKTKKLSTPNVTLNLDEQLGEYVVSWQEVANAEAYIVMIINVYQETTYVLSGSDLRMVINVPFTSVRVKAAGAGNYLDSEYSAAINK